MAKAKTKPVTPPADDPPPDGDPPEGVKKAKARKIARLTRNLDQSLGVGCTATVAHANKNWPGGSYDVVGLDEAGGIVG